MFNKHNGWIWVVVGRHACASVWCAGEFGRRILGLYVFEELGILGIEGLGILGIAANSTPLILTQLEVWRLKAPPMTGSSSSCPSSFLVSLNLRERMIKKK